MKTIKIEFTKGELQALYDAASHMQDDFIDYYSFMGPKRSQKHAENFSNAMDKILTKIKK